MKKVECKICGSQYHYQTFCPRKKNKPIRSESDKYTAKKKITNRQWRKINPPDKNGFWYCYLRISEFCPIKLTEATVVREHVIPKVKAPHLVFDPNNIRPACSFCNALKGSQTLEQLAQTYPQLKSLL